MNKTYTSSKKIFAALLAFVMVFGMVPFSADSGYSVEETDVIPMAGLPDMLYAGQVASTKKVEDLGGGTFEITLEVMAREFMTAEEQGEATEYDVVLVLDCTSSMAGNNLTNMQLAAQNAVNEILRFNTTAKYNRVAVVTFN